MNKTQIEWVKNPDGTQGYSWNPITGCLNGCPYCYARKLANGRLKYHYLSNDNVVPSKDNPEGTIYNPNPFYPRFWPERIEQGMLGESHNPRGVFTCDMSDLFGIGVPEEWTERVLNVIKWNESDRFYLLTKQPQNLQKFSPFPDNAWVGVSADGSFGMTANAFGYLFGIEAKVKYISFEPLLHEQQVADLDLRFKHSGISWVIIGAQTKPYNPPKIEWVREIVEAADKAGVPVFLKDNLLPLLGKLTVNDKWAWAKDLGYGGLQRQEMPVNANSSS